MKLNELTIKEASDGLVGGDFSAVSLTAACLETIREKNNELNACLEVNETSALEAAASADQRLKDGERGPLLGIPFLVKDNILAKGFKATAASRMLENYKAPYDATVVARLKAAGAVLLGKTNLDEFAHGASTETSFFGPTKNPFDTKQSPGGSSGGSAAAVASGMCLFALGTDTGGSVRHPASFCGVAGLKPTYGRCSRWGLISMTSSTDVPGVLAKTAADTAVVLSVMEGVDPRDMTTAIAPVRSEAENEAKLRVGVVKEFLNDQVDEDVKQAVRQAIKKFEQAGVKVQEVSLKHALLGVSVYYIITPAEISSNLARFDGWRYGHRVGGQDWQAVLKQNRGAGFGDEVKRRIMLGAYALSAGYHDRYYLKAQQVRSLIIKEMSAAFESVDVLLSPTTPGTAFKLGEQTGDPLKMYLEDIFLTPASLSGCPAISVPAGMSKGLPIGIQLMADKFHEAEMFRAAEYVK